LVPFHRSFIASFLNAAVVWHHVATSVRKFANRMRQGRVNPQRIAIEDQQLFEKRHGILEAIRRGDGKPRKSAGARVHAQWVSLPDCPCSALLVLIRLSSFEELMMARVGMRKLWF
jgi:hypothetical protein